jgi:predicted ribosomally synthesized peptide with SipW-like signal peptide
MKKRNLVLGSVVVLAALLIVGGTMAWFTASSGPVTNTFIAGTVDIELHDLTYDDKQELVSFPENGFANVNPGDEYDKIVYVENTGSKAVYVRVKLTPGWSGLPAGFDPEEDVVSLGSLGTNWVLYEGWYYYTKPLRGPVVDESNAVTTNLIEKVMFAGAEMTNDYQGATFTLQVEAEAVQASHEAYKDEWGEGINFLEPYPPTTP